MHKWKKNKHLKLYADCVVVKGVSRSTICDLSRNKYYLIPNDLADLLENYDSFTLEEIEMQYGLHNSKTIKNYINFLETNEFIFWCDEDELDYFPKLSLEWDTPSKVNNSIIDYDKNSNFSIENVLNQLESLGCFYLQIRCFDIFNITFIKSIFSLFNNTRFKGVELLLKYNDELSKDFLIKMCNDHDRIKSVTIYNSPFNTIIKNNSDVVIAFINNIIDNESHCGVISPNYFSTNISLFTEAQKFNTCLNRKISVDRFGLIKNCPSMEKNYGNVSDIKLKDVLNIESFKKLWLVNKDQINVCNVCEFRYICTDCRAYLDDSNTFSKPKKCMYNPYTNVWEKNID
jgi:SPASM domain peptide maturase of grasp-with-spasm system